MWPRYARQRGGKPGPVNALAARWHPCLQGRHEDFIGTLETRIPACAGVEQILAPRCLEPILVPAHVKRIRAHRDEVDEVRRSDAAEERLPFNKPLIQDPAKRRMPDTVVRSSIGHELLWPVAVVADIVRIDRGPRYDIAQRRILIEPILFRCQYLLFVHVNAHIAPLVVAQEKS